MPFNYDTLSPDDNADISLHPPNERSFRTTVESALNVEHDSAEMRHKFGIGTSMGGGNARDTISTWVVGSIWVADDVVAGQFVMQVLTALPSTWEDVGVVFLNENQVWTKAQYGTWIDLGTGGGAQTLDLTLGAGFHILADQNIIMNNPSPAPAAGESSSFVFEVLQDGGGPHAITWPGTNWQFPFSLAPDLTQTLNAKDQFSCIVGPTGKITVNVIPDLGPP